MFIFKSIALEREKGQVFIEDLGKPADGQDKDSRWSHVELDQPAAFDAFLQRIVSANPAQANASGSSAPWLPRSTIVSLDGLVLTPLSSPLLEDWEIRIFTVTVKGSASGTLTKGVIIEGVYLPVPYLPANSTYCRDFLKQTLFPDQVANEIEWLDIQPDELARVGLLTPEQAASGEWEWSDAHTAWTLLTRLRAESLI